MNAASLFCPTFVYMCLFLHCILYFDKHNNLELEVFLLTLQ